jgi:hypothetical protein
MKILSALFTAIGVLVIVAVAALLAANYFFPEGGAAIDQVSLISQAGLEEIMASSQKIGGMLTWFFVLLALCMQAAAWAVAIMRFRRVCNLDVSEEEKLEQLEHLEIYFDLPLYLGLLGTVISFILIAIYPDTGLMYAYASTALGIIVSVILRLGYLTPYQQSLTRILYADSSASTRKEAA